MKNTFRVFLSGDINQIRVGQLVSEISFFFVLDTFHPDTVQLGYINNFITTVIICSILSHNMSVTIDEYWTDDRMSCTL
jgi:hypothetical protein